MNSLEPQRVQARFKLGYPGFQLDVDLDLAGRGVTALFGPSGSGKTSCLRAIAGLERRAKGYLAVNGEVWQDDDHDLFRPVHRRALGYVFQEADLFGHLNVAQNLAYGLNRVPLAQRRVALEQTVALLGIGHLMQRQPATLSGGERQRVAIARALACSPRILLLDEPLAALDAQRKAEVLPYLEKLQGELDIPVLYVSHALDEVARLAQHMVLLEAGSVSASGRTDALLTRLDLPLAHGDTAGAVLSVTVASHDPDDHLTTARLGDALLSLPMQVANVGQPLRIRVQARDVSLTLQQQSGTSILNILRATVSAIAADSPGQVMVSLDVAGCPLLARITARSARTLGLTPGLALYAQIKGVAILG
ncbi:MAG: molybdenum ABC transporter ATP-binding protein [Rhodoferax sp.]|uniref:molybdenum ABC transporter ATP-binding protein n=1 Tax=Rhodoferax sp. TaxID=50421 RepID=UPI00262638F2|nr:molybdenum ABC transporter ATP-binding protein [Rhodoferax sp.]MDD5334110.1 molybdenum ABC transporter ATP-binding protein [Rhodoferax sp.]